MTPARYVRTKPTLAVVAVCTSLIVLEVSPARTARKKAVSCEWTSGSRDCQSGNVLDELHNRDLSKCKLGCQLHPDCTGVSHSPIDSKCLLKSGGTDGCVEQPGSCHGEVCFFSLRRQNSTARNEQFAEKTLQRDDTGRPSSTRKRAQKPLPWPNITSLVHHTRVSQASSKGDEDKACLSIGFKVTGETLANKEWWAVHCQNISKVNPTSILLHMGSVRDYFKPVDGASWCKMFSDSDRHLWSSDNNNWQAPAYFTEHKGNYGGSSESWPINNDWNDGRTYLSFWGSEASSGGCCADSYDESGGRWQRDFEILVCPTFENPPPIVQLPQPASLSVSVLPTHHLRQYENRFCAGRYVAINLKVLVMQRLNIPDLPKPICNMLTASGEVSGETSYTLHSCAAKFADGDCPTDCYHCGTQYVKQMLPGTCKEGWELMLGPAPKDCTGEGEHATINVGKCGSVDAVDVGLGRWCSKWPS